MKGFGITLGIALAALSAAAPARAGGFLWGFGDNVAS